LLLIRRLPEACRTLPTADFSPFICCDYFGLAKNQESVIEITKSRDDGHLPWR
jgi:hypothetical protein